MSDGIFEKVLQRKFGNPNLGEKNGHNYLIWNKDSKLESILYLKMASDSENLYPALVPIYGNCVGGFILGDSIKISLIKDVDIFGLYKRSDLIKQPEICIALKINDTIDYFMDASNEWFYGIYGQRLFEYNADDSEINELGYLEPSFEKIINEWVDAKN